MKLHLECYVKFLKLKNYNTSKFKSRIISLVILLINTENQAFIMISPAHQEITYFLFRNEDSFIAFLHLSLLNYTFEKLVFQFFWQLNAAKVQFRLGGDNMAWLYTSQGNAIQQERSGHQ